MFVKRFCKSDFNFPENKKGMQFLLKCPPVKSVKIYFNVTLAVCHPQKRAHIDQQTGSK